MSATCQYAPDLRHLRTWKLYAVRNSYAALPTPRHARLKNGVRMCYNWLSMAIRPIRELPTSVRKYEETIEP